MSTPRTWTLEGDLAGVPHEPRTRVSDGYVDISEGPIEVIEKAPVDAERERLLDLVERLLDWATPFRDSAEGEPGCLVDRDAATAALREHGRLAARRPGA